jgi:hypothetical protein
MNRNPHFAAPADWAAAAELVTFEPRRPSYTAGHALQSLAVYVLDHRKREVPVRARSLEAHYGAFMFSQAWKGVAEARRHALSVAYGPSARTVDIAAREGRAYELGPEPEPDDIDGRPPAVVTWADGEMFYLAASTKLDTDVLARIAASLYDAPSTTERD